MGQQGWEVTDTREIPFSESLEDYLAKGWEPFAAYFHPKFGRVVVLRREKWYD